MGKSRTSFLLSAFERAHWPAAEGRAEVAFVGRSNVGKSSCLNTLVGGSSVARVSKTPGRTQSINFFEVPRRGGRLLLADLPGYGYAKVPRSVTNRWDRMVGEYLTERTNLVLVVILVDLRRDPTELDRKMIQWLEESGRVGLLVFTKADKIAKSKRLHRRALLCRGLGVPMEASLLFSSLQKIGREELWKRIDEAVLGLAEGDQD
ncbi:MAG: YihA family ribosome biogenesis GTP-binding protein [Rickettsiales bacterium]|nr:YihA family ribosome biogenesis GTP-binding protein [Rickettsiales bacterium]